MTFIICVLLTGGQMLIIPKAGRWKSSCAHAKAAAIAPGLQNAENIYFKIRHYITFALYIPSKDTTSKK